MNPSGQYGAARVLFDCGAGLQDVLLPPNTCSPSAWLEDAHTPGRLLGSPADIRASGSGGEVVVSHPGELGAALQALAAYGSSEDEEAESGAAGRAWLRRCSSSPPAHRAAGAALRLQFGLSHGSQQARPGSPAAEDGGGEPYPLQDGSPPAAAGQLPGRRMPAVSPSGSENSPALPARGSITARRAAARKVCFDCQPGSSVAGLHDHACEQSLSRSGASCVPYGSRSVAATPRRSGRHGGARPVGGASSSAAVPASTPGVSRTPLRRMGPAAVAAADGVGAAPAPLWLNVDEGGDEEVLAVFDRYWKFKRLLAAGAGDGPPPTVRRGKTAVTPHSQVGPCADSGSEAEGTFEEDEESAGMLRMLLSHDGLGLPAAKAVWARLSAAVEEEGRISSSQLRYLLRIIPAATAVEWPGMTCLYGRFELIPCRSPATSKPWAYVSGCRQGSGRSNQLIVLDGSCEVCRIPMCCLSVALRKFNGAATSAAHAAASLALQSATTTVHGKRLSERQRQGGCRGLLVALFTLVCAPAKLLGPSECTAAQQKQLAAGKGLRAFQRCIYLDTSGAVAQLAVTETVECEVPPHPKDVLPFKQLGESKTGCWRPLKFS